MATGIVSASSALVRKRWLREGLLQAAAKSYWAAYTGNTSDSIIHQVNNENAATGHTVTFDYDGNLSAKAVKDKTTAFGRGEQKKKFSTSITVARYRLVVDNGDKFDAANIGDLNISQHTDSRAKLSDLFIRWKDQAIFDVAQGFKGGSPAPHRIYYDGSTTPIGYAQLAAIEKTLRTGTLYHVANNPLGYSIGTIPSTAPGASLTTRAPLEPFKTQDGRSIWLLVIDPATAYNIKSNTVANSGIIALSQHADLRGNNNRIFKGLIGQIGQLVIVEAEAFFGVSDGGTGLDATGVEICGLRGYDSANGWAGTSAYSSQTHSRNLIMGKNAIQMAFGKQPDYKFQASQDFGIKSESAVEFWMNAQKTVLTADNEDYNMALRAGMDYGVIPFDVKL